MSSKRISDSDFTVGWLEEVLQKELQTKATITDVTWNEIGFGMGMLSQILIVKIQWNTEDESLPKSVVFKIPSTKQIQKAVDRLDDDDAMKEGMETLHLDDLRKSPLFKVHQCEVAVYDHFRKHPPPKEVKAPRSYFCSDIGTDKQGIIVVEDLSHGKATTLVGGLTGEQMIEVAKAVAALQAYSLTSDDWKNETMNVTFDKIVPENFPTVDQMMPQAVAGMKASNPELFDPLADEALRFCKTQDDVTFILKLNQELGLPDVFCQGDLHAQNFMFNKEADGTAGNELLGLLDWQITHQGNMAEDFARCFTSSVSAEVRRANTMKALEVYYEMLKKHLGKDPPFTFDQVLYCYKQAFKFGALIILPALSFLPKNPEMLGDKPEEAMKEMNLRMKALIEDMVMYDKELNGEK